METQDSIYAWGRETFGKATAATLADRCADEMGELLAAVHMNDRVGAAEECADVFIVLVQVAEELGFTLHQLVNSKMKVNRARKWKVNGDGTGQHEP